MMRRLVHEKAAGTGEQRVPAAKVIGPMLHIEIPVEVDRRDLADHTREDRLLDLLCRRRVAVVEADIDAPAGPRFGREDAAAVFGGRRHRLFGDHVDAGFERLDDDIGVRVVARADDERIGPSRPQHFCRIGESRRGNPDGFAGALQAQRILVRQADQLDQLTEALQELLAPGAGAAMAGPHQGHAPLAISHGSPPLSLTGCRSWRSRNSRCWRSKFRAHRIEATAEQLICQRRMAATRVSATPSREIHPLDDIDARALRRIKSGRHRREVPWRQAGRFAWPGNAGIG